MLNMKYGDVLEIEWALRKAELAAKREWDGVIEYSKKGDLIYDLRYESVKELREAQKKLRNMYKVIKNSDIEVEYGA